MTVMPTHQVTTSRWGKKEIFLYIIQVNTDFMSIPLV